MSNKTIQKDISFLSNFISRDEEDNWNILRKTLRKQSKKIETDDIIARLDEIYNPTISIVNLNPIEGKLFNQVGDYIFTIKDQHDKKRVWYAKVNINDMIPHQLGQFTIFGNEQRYFIPSLNLIDSKGTQKVIRTILNSKSTYDYCRKPITRGNVVNKMVNLQQIYVSSHCEIVFLRIIRGDIKVSFNAKTYKDGPNSRFQVTFSSDKVQKSTNVGRLGAHVFHQYIGWDPLEDDFTMQAHHIDGQNTNDSILINSNLILLPPKFHLQNIHFRREVMNWQECNSYRVTSGISIYDLQSVLIYMLGIKYKDPHVIVLPIPHEDEVA